MHIILVGFGMTGQKLLENIIQYDKKKILRITVFGEEPVHAYDRVNLTKYIEHRDASRLILKEVKWYDTNSIKLYLGDKVIKVDPKIKQIISESGVVMNYDKLILAMGSYAFVPNELRSFDVCVYRTLEDIEKILLKISTSRNACIIGGGLLGLEAAKVCIDAGIEEVNLVDRGSHLMSRQLDSEGGKILTECIEKMGINVYSNSCLESNGKIKNRITNEESEIPLDLIIVAAGIRPADSLALTISTVNVHLKGGIEVDDQLKTTDPDIFAIGEVALHRGIVYGLVNPCYEQAKVLAHNICLPEEEPKSFVKGDISAKLKLLGINIASFGEYMENGKDTKSLIFHDPFAGIYRKLIFSTDGKRLIGGMLVGDVEDYSQLQLLSRSKNPLKISPGSLISPTSTSSREMGADSFSEETQICSCNDVTKGQICKSVIEGCSSLEEISDATSAGTGCGGCKPLVTQIMEYQLKELGQTISKSICEHFDFSRSELFHIVRVSKIKTFEDLIIKCGKGSGCDICKPIVASIFASAWNDFILKLDTAVLQDSNDRFLANIQRGASYSVIPRIPGGEITPKKLRILAETAEKFGLYTKITGGQRIDMFGALKEQLPEIWEDLVDAGFESGHAYGKSFRTVKSCVGSTWCRYGMRDSVGFAIKIENRYKGVRSPHKLKGGVSGCIRECAEARSKDFGLIAVEGGYNLYVCGNGGSKPCHGQLLVSSAKEDDIIKYVDRFFAFYIQTAEPLQRTARWLENLEGGIEYLRKVILEDSLGIAKELEEYMSQLISFYKCEWAEVVKNEKAKKQFLQFVNTGKTQKPKFVEERQQIKPILKISYGNEKKNSLLISTMEWVKVTKTEDVPKNGGVTILYGDCQIAVFNFASKDKWFATQNMCPHENALVLSQGILGDKKGNPIVSCPMHKKKFNLEGESTETFKRFKVKIEEENVFLYLPPQEILNNMLAEKIELCTDKRLEW